MKLGLGLYRHMLTRDYYDFARQGRLHSRGCAPGRLLQQRHIEPAQQPAYRRKVRTLGSGRRSCKNFGRWRNSKKFGTRSKRRGWFSPPSRISTLRIGMTFFWTAPSVPNRSRRSKQLFVGWAKRAFRCWVTTSAWRGFAGVSRRRSDAATPSLWEWTDPPKMCPFQTERFGTWFTTHLRRRARCLRFRMMSYGDASKQFLAEVVPVAEQSGVRMAAHPDDPPMPTMRRQPPTGLPAAHVSTIDRCRAELEQRFGTLRGHDRRNDRGRCLRRRGSLQPPGKDCLHPSAQRVGKVPSYRETFIDEGDVDMIRVLSILARNKFDGVIIPDHTPQMTCPAPWHAGMAHTLGFILAAQAMLGQPSKSENS